MVVYYNGEFVQQEEVHLSLDDRGFLFGDGVYEVIRTYHRRFFQMDGHLARLARSLAELRIEFHPVEQLKPVAERLLAESHVETEEAKVYIQITRGASPRAHSFPSGKVSPTVYATLKPLQSRPEEQEDGVSVITTGDTRWARCDIKSLMLLPNVLAFQQALDAGAQEAIFLRDGFVTEASHTSLFGVFGDVVVTAPLSNLVLPGITREVVLQLCAQEGVPVQEFPIAEDRLRTADELFLTGTSAEVTPVVTLDQRPVGTGKPGPVVRTLQRAFRRMVAGLAARPAQ
jgi:D-alanine transaminase